MRRLVVWLVSALVLLAGLGSIGWFVFIPQYKPGLQLGERYGVDVSNHQGDVDWNAVANDDISFAYVKASEGADFVDVQYSSHWEGARAAGLRTGSYHFFTLCSDGASQAENFLNVVGRETDALPPAIDLELAGNCSERPDREVVEGEVTAFVERVEAELDAQMLLYVGKDFESTYGISEWLDRSHWRPVFVLRPQNNNWLIWQVMGEARVDGIEGKADLNIARGALFR